MKTQNNIWDEDKNLFASKIKESRTHEEFNFYNNMKFKEECEPTLSNDLILSEQDNALGIYIVRLNYDEYLIGQISNRNDEIYAKNLSEALNVKLSDLGIRNCEMTIGQWLQSVNYRGVKYNQNYDNL